jgi:hypothetical protein
MSRTLSVFLILNLIITQIHAAIEPKTGIFFADHYAGCKLDALGVRYKGPIKVYALGKYSTTFMLKMNMGVSAEKIASSTADAIRPRCLDDKTAVDDFQKMLIAGLPNGCSKGTCMAFSTGGGKLAISVNDKSIGAVNSKALARAFADVYTDKKAVLQLKPVP